MPRWITHALPCTFIMLSKLPGFLNVTEMTQHILLLHILDPQLNDVALMKFFKSLLAV